MVKIITKKIKKEPKLTIENCGRWFDDYVLEYNGNTYIESEAKNLPRDILKKLKPNPYSAAAVLEIYSDIDKSYVNAIRERENITRKEFEFIISKI